MSHENLTAPLPEDIRRIEDKKLIVRRIESVFEILVFCLFYYLIWNRFYRYSPDFINPLLGRGKWVLLLIYAILTLIIVHMNEGWRFGHFKILDVMINQWVALFMVDFITYLELSLMSAVMLDPLPMLLLWGLELPVATASTIIFSVYYRHRIVPYNMLLIYGNENAVSLKFKMDTRQEKYHVAKLVSADAPMSELAELMKKYNAVIISDIPADKRNEILKYNYAHGIRTYLTPKVSDIIESGAKSINLFDTPLMLVRGLGLSIGNRIAKRTFDIVVSLICLILFSPLMLAICIAIKLEDHGPVIYKQERVTLNGRKFDILKFRSMIVDAEKDNNSIPATDEDPRITKVGKIIRACRIDELPQLINILKGDMSVVGPRPERTEHVEKYTNEIPEWPLRNKVKGGLTGYAQIYGKYNTAPLDKLRLDLMYIENYSFLLDIKIILMTVRILFEKESTEGFDKQITIEEIKAEVERAEAENRAEGIIVRRRHPRRARKGKRN